MKKLFVAALYLGAFSTAIAQEKNVEEILVTGKVIDLPYQKSNANITLITKAEIQKIPAQSIEEVLAYYTGIDIRRRGANGVQTDISLRGSSFEQVLVLINGIRVNDPQTGHNTLNFPFDVSSVERIEIIKGPAARRFGQGAYAGVINVVTKPSTDNQITVNGEGGDYNTFSAGVGAHFGNGNFRNQLQVTHTSSDGYRYNTDYKITNAYYQNQYALKQGVLKFQAGFQEKKFGANGFYASPAFTDQYEEVQMSLVSASLDKKINDNISLSAKTYWRRAQDMYLFRRFNPSFYRNMHIGNQVGLDLSSQVKNAWGTTGIGIETRKEFLESNRLGSRERWISQAFLEHHFSFFQDALLISPGVSWSSIEGKNYFYPGIDAAFLQGNHKWFANFSKVNRIPTYTDLYYVSPSEVGNPNLKPESALTGEFGYQYQVQQNFFKASLFWRKTDNTIDWQKLNSTSPWTAQNIGALETKGIEIESNLQLAQWTGLSLGYTYLDNQNLEKNVISRYALDNLRHQFVAKWRVNHGRFSNELIYRYNERVNLGSYNLLDDRISYQLKDWNLYLLVNNITNSKYTETSLVPMPGRWFHIGFNYRMKW